MLNIFVNTWGNYNVHGADGGEWVTLPMDADELENELARIAAAMGDNDPEWAIHDFEWTSEIELREINELENINELNEELQEIDSLDEWEQEEIAAAMEAFEHNFCVALEYQRSGYYTFYRGMDLTDVAEELVNECYFTRNTPDIFTRYFDYEAFGRDLRFDGYEETKYGVIYCC